MTLKRHSRSDAPGFTLVEVLTAATVLVVLLVLIAELVNNTSRITGNVQQRMTVDSAARQTLDRIGADFRQMILREDLPALFQKEELNDSMTFTAASEGYEGDRGVSGVTYSILNHRLARGVRGAWWKQAGKMLAFTPAEVSPVGAADSEAAAADIFRLETAFLMDDGTRLAAPPDPSLVGSGSPGGPKVVAVLVGIAVLDPRARLALPDEDLAPLISLFEDAQDHTDLLSRWKDALEGAELPPAVRAGVRIYQRYYPINPKPF